LPAGCATKSVLDANLKTNGELDLSAITPFVFNRPSESTLGQARDTDRLCA
jgi:hypothetical protein